jgi:hypothetical protein
MRDLDSRGQVIMREIDSISNDFLSNSQAITREKKKELDGKLQASAQMLYMANGSGLFPVLLIKTDFCHFCAQRLFGKAKEYADDKVQLAIQTYELVDKHIRRLDSDLARFESEIKNGTVNLGPAGTIATLMSPRLASVNALAAAEAAEAEKANKSK